MIAKLHHRLFNLHVTGLGVRPIHGVVPAEVSKPAALTARLVALLCSLARLTTEVDPLAPLPALNTKEEQHCLDKDNTPLPGDTAVLEDLVVDDWDVQDRESEDETSHDSEEEELVAPDVMHPLREVALGVGLHLEKAAAEIHHFPGEEEGKPSHAGEGCRTGAENSVASIGLCRVVVLSVTAGGKISITPSEHHESKG